MDALKHLVSGVKDAVMGNHESQEKPAEEPKVEEPKKEEDNQGVFSKIGEVNLTRISKLIRSSIDIYF